MVPPAARTPVPPDPDRGEIDRAIRLDLSSVASGLVLGVRQLGETTALEARGTIGPSDDARLRADHLFAFPAFTEILVAATIRAYHEAGALDATAPLHTVVSDLPENLRGVSFDQLLTHMAGLDDLPPPDDFDWARLLADVSGAALFTEPGLIHSRSRYSLPLAIQILERWAGTDVTSLVSRSVIEPLGMTETTFDLEEAPMLGLASGHTIRDRDRRDPVAVVPETSVDGVPVVFTTTSDVFLLFDAVLQGRIRGSVLETSTKTVEGGPQPRLRDGLRVEAFRGERSVFLTGSAQGFGYHLRVLPDHHAAMLVWRNGTGNPRRTARFLEERLAEALGLPSEDPAGPPTTASPVDPGVDPLAWVGTYRNGEKIVVLNRAESGLTFFDGSRDLPVEPLGGGDWLVRVPDGRPALTFRTMELGGRRFVVVGDYAHELRRPGG